MANAPPTLDDVGRCDTIRATTAASAPLIKPLFLTIAIVAAEPTAIASEELFRPTTTGPFITYTAMLTPKMQLLLQPIVSVATSSSLHDENGTLRRADTGYTVTTLSLFAELGLLDWLTVGTQLYLVDNQATRGPANARTTSFGDMQVFSRVLLVAENQDWRPEIALFTQLKLPTGKADRRAPGLLRTDISGTGSTDVSLGVNLTKGIRPFLLHADLMYTHLFLAMLDGQAVQYGELFNWSIAGEWLFYDTLLAFVVEAAGRHQTPRFVSGALVPASDVHELTIGAGFEVLLSSWFQLLIGYQRTAWGKNIAAADTAIISLLVTL